METYGSIVMPSALCGIVGLKPTTGLASRSGMIPISFTRDATGPMARTVTDVATLLNGMVGVDPLDDATAVAAPHTAADYRDALDADGLAGARIGVWRRKDLWRDERVARVIEDAIELIAGLGATIVDPVDIPDWGEATGTHIGVMFLEFRYGMNRYLRGLTHPCARPRRRRRVQRGPPEGGVALAQPGAPRGVRGPPPLPDPELSDGRCGRSRQARAAGFEPPWTATAWMRSWRPPSCSLAHRPVDGDP